MLDIRIIGGEDDEYLVFTGHGWLGPFSSRNGDFVESQITDEYRQRFLKEEEGLYGENTVRHHDVTGTWYCAGYDGIESIPFSREVNPGIDIESYPYRIRFLGERGWQYSEYGFITEGSKMYYQLHSYRPWNYDHRYDDNRWFIVVHSNTHFSDFQVNSTWYDEENFGYCLVTRRETEITNFALTGERRMHYRVTVYQVPGDRKVNHQRLQEILALEGLDKMESRVTYEVDDWYEITRWRVTPAGNFDQLTSVIEQSIKECEEKVIDLPYISSGLLSQNAINSSRIVSFNAIENLREIFKPQSWLFNLKNWLSLKSNADRYLTINYGYLPTSRDIAELSSALKTLRENVTDGQHYCYSSKIVSGQADFVIRKLERRLKIAYRSYDNALFDLFRRMDSWGTLPTFSRIWDLIPYSFVIDWFIDIGKSLESIDNSVRYHSLPLLYSTESTKDVRTGFGRIVEGTLFVDYVFETKTYQRINSEKVPLPEFTWDASGPSIRNWIDGAALITQRLK